MNDNDFKYIINLKKEFINLKNNLELPAMQTNKIYNLRSTTSLHEFHLDYDRRGAIELKHKIQLRNKTHKTIPLVRLEINGPLHANPDGKIISRNHVHIYKEKYDDRFAYELSDIFPIINQSSTLSIFTDFCIYCNIIINNNLQEVL